MPSSSVGGRSPSDLHPARSGEDTAWLIGYRRPHRRYERKADHFLAYTSIACTLICYRKLTK